jgi:hypothetical protein
LSGIIKLRHVPEHVIRWSIHKHVVCIVYAIDHHVVRAEEFVQLHWILILVVFRGNILGATGTRSVSSEVRFKLVPMNLLSRMLLVEINQMLSSVALSSCVIVTTTPLTSLRVFMSIIFLESVLVVVRTLCPS